MANYTQGPWNRSTSYHSGKNLAICSGAQVIANVVGTGYPTGKGWSPESEANARLIAAAPAMLDALLAVLDLAEIGADYTGEDTDRERVAVVREAIALAAGGAGK